MPASAVDDSYTLDQDTVLDTDDQWMDPTWAHRRKLTFLNGSWGSLTDFPVLLALDSSNIDYSKTMDAGEDLRFTDPDGALLKYEIEVWDELGTSYVWVKVPEIDASSNSDFIWMYYGKTGGGSWR